MPEFKHNFQTGRMNKDLDERLVPNGEYRDALNIEVSTSEGSDVGSLQTTMGNELRPLVGTPGGLCVGSIVDEKNDKLYYLISASGIDYIVEYDHAGQSALPVCVDLHANIPANRVLNFNPSFPITGINIIDGILFWTDDNTEPKRIHIQRGKDGSTGGWGVHTQLRVRDTLTPFSSIIYMNGGPIREEHLTVIKISPPMAPVLEMKDTLVPDINADGEIGMIDGTISMVDANGDGINPFVDCFQGGFIVDTTVTIDFNCDPLFPFIPPCPDYSVGDYLTISVAGEPNKKIRVLIMQAPTSSQYVVQFQSGDPDITCEDVVFDVTLEQVEPLFQFKFPRFGYRYKYEDGEYSTFSPFTEVAFLPGDFYYLPREGYNLGMVNNLRKLAIKDFVHERLIPDDVVSIDILYKESNSINIYSVKTVKRVTPDPGGMWDAWNGDTRTSIDATGTATRGYLPIKSEMIHAVLPANQLLRPWDNVPRKALAQEITKNRLVYGNYLQNYNLFSLSPLENDIDVQVGIITRPRDITGVISPEQYNPADAYNYRIVKSVKSLRTYQVGVVYIDEYGRETPVFSSDKRGTTGVDTSSLTSLYVDKSSANQGTKLGAHVNSTAPEWATAFKFFVKETSNEYYNMAMDRWYDAEDGNIWLSFPSSERNKVDEETFLILKKEHDNSNFVDEPARYKILAIENEAPPFIKLEPSSLGSFTDTPTGTLIGVNGGGGTGWPFVGSRSFFVDKTAADLINWDTVILNTDIANVYFRFRSPTSYGKWYKMLSFTFVPTGLTYYEISTKNPFGSDMALTSADNTYTNRTGGLVIEVVRRQEVNKPEFEGRFFVKVVKDNTLIKRIIKPMNGTSYVIEQSAMSSYINPQPNANPNAGPSALHGGPLPHAGVPLVANSWFQQNPNNVSVIRSNQAATHRPGGSTQGDGND